MSPEEIETIRRLVAEEVRRGRSFDLYRRPGLALGGGLLVWAFAAYGLWQLLA